MDESVFSVEHDAGYHDFDLGGAHWESMSPANQDASADLPNFGVLGDQNSKLHQQLARQMFDPAFEDPTNKIETYPHLPFTGLLWSDTAYDHDQLSSQPQFGSLPVSMHFYPNLAKNDSYPGLCGVSSPKKLSSTRHNQSTDSAYHGPRCNKGFTKRTGVKDHFSNCIKKHGNPSRLRWDDHASLEPLRKGETRDMPPSYQFRGGEIRHKARTDRFRDTLKQFSGVVIPSRLPPGQAPVKFVSSTRASSKIPAHHFCAVCGGGTF